MTNVSCLGCGLEQDFEAAIGYCEKCGRKLPVPHLRGKTVVRQQMASQQRVAEVGASNVVATVCIALALLAGVLVLAFLIIRNAL